MNNEGERMFNVQRSMFNIQMKKDKRKIRRF